MMRGELKRPRSEDLRNSPVILASFAYKGGVGKTTISLNLAAALAVKGHRVGLVDCDSQCTLSTFFFFNPQPKPGSKAVGETDGKEEEGYISYDGEVQDEDSSSDMEDEADALRGRLPSYEHFFLDPGAYEYPVELAKQGYVDSCMKFPVTVKTLWEDARDDKEIGTDIIDLHNNDNFKENSTFPEGLFLVPGDPNLSLLETAFHNACHMMHMRGSIEPFRVLSAFRRALHHVGRVHNLKYIICDFGPSAGVLNQILVMSCDYILPCFQPDFFSASAVYGFLHNVLPDWLGIFNSIRLASKLNLTDPRFAFNPLPPRILPFLMNNFVLEGKEMLTPMDSAFFSLVERVVNSEEDPVSDDVRALFLPDGSNCMALPFLPSVPVVLKVAQGIAQPAVLIDSALLKKIYKASVPRGAPAQSRLIGYAFIRLAFLVVAACLPRRRRPVPVDAKRRLNVPWGSSWLWERDLLDEDWTPPPPAR
eukprot:jgi/Mesvir1/18181/Mv09468-RA.1